jgi:hypothetical protein
MYLSEHQLRQEIRSLLYLGIVTNRSVIIPNVLSALFSSRDHEYGTQRHVLWPGFRIAHFANLDKFKLDILEPAFYWRIRRDYCIRSDAAVRRTPTKPQHVPDAALCIPSPTVLSVPDSYKLASIESRLLSSEYSNVSRLVIGVYPRKSAVHKDIVEHAAWVRKLKIWADDSVGVFAPLNVEEDQYGILPELKYDKNAVAVFFDKLGNNNVQRQMQQLLQMTSVGSIMNEASHVRYMVLANEINRDVRLCANILDEPKGNRSCFDKCK